jgi:PAS domain S-box
MRIRPLLFIFTVALVLTTTLVVGLIGYKVSQGIVARGYRDSLTQARIAKTRILENTFEGLSNALMTTADLLSTRGALREFERSQREITLSLLSQGLPNEYRNTLFHEYGADKNSEMGAFVARLTNFPVYLQSSFLKSATSRGVQKKSVIDVSTPSKFQYFRHHSTIHARYLDYLERYKLSDIFMIDHTGTVLYSVQKNLELGTNLITGPFQSTALSEAYRWSITAPPRSTRFFDFAKGPYSSAGPTGFLAAPVFDRDQFVGTVVFSISLQTIDKLLSDDGQWKANGMMNSGEVLAFSLEGELRNNLRAYVEHPEATESALSRIDESAVEKTRRDKSTALNVSLSQVRLQELREKSEFVEVAPSFLGTTSVISVGRVPLPGGGQWMLVARMNYSEATEPLKSYLGALTFGAFFISLAALFIIYFIARHIVRPIQKVTEGLVEIRDSTPVTPIFYDSHDEIGDLVTQYNETAQKIESSTVTKYFLDSVIQSLHELLFVIKIKHNPETNQAILTVQNINAAAAEMIGLPAAELRDTDLANWIDADFDNIIKNLPTGSVDRTTFRTEGFVTGLKGERVPLQITLARIQGRSNEEDLVLVGSDIRWRKESEKKILEQEELLRESQTMSQTGSFLWETNSNKTIWTDEVYHIFGLQAEKQPLTHELFESLIIPEDKVLFEEEIREARKKIKPIDLYVRARKADTQELIWIHVMGRSEFDDYGDPARVVGSIQDVTALKKTELDLISAKNDALKSNQAKSEFLARMSHEIRTPMNAIMGMAELLTETKLDKDQRYYVTVFCKAGEVLMALINDILDLSKIEAGEVSVENIPFDLKNILESVSAMMKPRGLEKGLDFSYEISPGISEHLMGDPTKLHQVLVNLVGNAVKFTERGHIRINVSKNPTRNDSLVISVTDTGHGIAASKHHLIFQKFSQADSTISRKFGGTGLGLAISKSLVELMGGQIWFKSRENLGTTFSFSIPYREQILNPITHQPILTHTPTEAEFVPLKPVAPNKKLRILLADDTDDNRTLFTHYLKNTDYEIVEAQNGLEAVEKIKSNKFDIIFMDVQMPEMDGYAATAAIREWEQSHHQGPTPIIALTAHALSEDRKRSLQMGCDDHITKPFKKDTLIDVINRYSH